jgi:hypothetical protein
VSVIPRLREAGLQVHVRYLSHSSCTPVPHTSDPTGGELSVRRPCECGGHYHNFVLDCMYYPEDADELTYDLPETGFYQWMIVVAVRQ